MPNIQMFIPQGVADQPKAELIAHLTEATCQSLDASADSVRVWLTEIPSSSFGCGGVVEASAAGGEGLAFIQAILIAGRTETQKAALIASMTDAVVLTLGVPKGIVRVAVQDIPNTDFGIAGATAKSIGRGVGRQV